MNEDTNTHKLHWSFDAEAGLDDSSLIGYDAVATDGSIGSVTEESVAVGSAHIVVDTGAWIFGTRRLVPAGAVRQVDHDNECVYLSVSKGDVKDAPEYVPESDITSTSSYRDDHERYYAAWVGPLR